MKRAIVIERRTEESVEARKATLVDNEKSYALKIERTNAQRTHALVIATDLVVYRDGALFEPVSFRVPPGTGSRSLARTVAARRVSRISSPVHRSVTGCPAGVPRPQRPTRTNHEEERQGYPKKVKVIAQNAGADPYEQLELDYLLSFIQELDATFPMERCDQANAAIARLEMAGRNVESWLDTCST